MISKKEEDCLVALSRYYNIAPKHRNEIETAFGTESMSNYWTYPQGIDYFQVH